MLLLDFCLLVGCFWGWVYTGWGWWGDLLGNAASRFPLDADFSIGSMQVRGPGGHLGIARFNGFRLMLDFLFWVYSGWGWWGGLLGNAATDETIRNW